MIVYLHKANTGNLYLSNYKRHTENFTYITWMIKIDKKDMDRDDWDRFIKYNWILYKP